MTEPKLKQETKCIETWNKNHEADCQLKVVTTHKTKKENLKPRKTNRPCIQFIQGNLQKSQTGQIQLNKRKIGKKKFSYASSRNHTQATVKS